MINLVKRPFRHGEKHDPADIFQILTRNYGLCPECGRHRIPAKTKQFRQESVCPNGHTWHLDYRGCVTKGKYFESAEYFNYWNAYRPDEFHQLPILI